jgi:hypothetical protein
VKHVFRVVWAAIKDFGDELFLLVLMNVVTVLLIIPVVTFPPAWAGLWNAANLVAQGRTIHWSDYFAGFRRYFWEAWLLALLNILVVVIATTNTWFYGPDVAPFEISPTLNAWIGGVFVAMGVLWTALQMYLWAVLLEQEDQRLRLALRNAAILFIANPGFTIVLLVLLVAVAVVSWLVVLPWLLFTLALFAVVCNKAVIHLLENPSASVCGRRAKRQVSGRTCSGLDHCVRLGGNLALHQPLAPGVDGCLRTIGKM